MGRRNDIFFFIQRIGSYSSKSFKFFYFSLLSFARTLWHLIKSSFYYLRDANCFLTFSATPGLRDCFAVCWNMSADSFSLSVRISIRTTYGNRCVLCLHNLPPGGGRSAHLIDQSSTTGTEQVRMSWNTDMFVLNIYTY